MMTKEVKSWSCEREVKAKVKLENSERSRKRYWLKYLEGYKSMFIFGKSKSSNKKEQNFFVSHCYLCTRYTWLLHKIWKEKRKKIEWRKENARWRQKRMKAEDEERLDIIQTKVSKVKTIIDNKLFLIHLYDLFLYHSSLFIITRKPKWLNSKRIDGHICWYYLLDKVRCVVSVNGTNSRWFHSYISKSKKKFFFGFTYFVRLNYKSNGGQNSNYNN